MSMTSAFARGFFDELDKLAGELVDWGKMKLPNIAKNPPPTPGRGGTQVGVKLPGMKEEKTNKAPLPAFPQAVQAP